MIHCPHCKAPLPSMYAREGRVQQIGGDVYAQTVWAHCPACRLAICLTRRFSLSVETAETRDDEFTLQALREFLGLAVAEGL